MTFREKFDHLKKTYGEKADFSGTDAEFAAQLTLTDADCGGTFYIAHTGGVTAIEPYDYHDHTVAVRVDSGLLEKILKGDADPVAAFLNGEMDVEGEPEHALLLIGALKKTENKKRK